MSTNKELQESRIRGYFIEAAKETLKGEGIKALSVRTVAERAGYSFATLYNYFKDLNELIFICVKDFMDECEAYINEQSSTMQPGKERLRVRMWAYITYFTQYPGIFEVFLVERINDIGGKQPTARMIYEFTDRIGLDDFTYLEQEGIIDHKTAELVKLNIRNSITGLMLLYNNRLQPSDYLEFKAMAEKQIGISLGFINQSS